LKYGNGLTLLRSRQCPYTQKNVNEIVKTAVELFDLEVNVIELDEFVDAQIVPCAFGTFCIIYNGKVISYHPISSTRFKNIMNKILN